MVAPSVATPREQRRRWQRAMHTALWAAIGAGSLLLLAKSVANSGEFGKLQPWMLLLNLIGVIALVALLTRKISQLVRDYRNHVPGSRLTARTVTIFGALVAAPLLIVYLSSLEFLSRGIDSWFKLEIKQGLGEAVTLSRAALDTRMREDAARTDALAKRLSPLADSSLAAEIEEARRAFDALEVVLLTRNGEVMISSIDGAAGPAPHAPSDLLRQVGARGAYMSLEPQTRGQYLIRTAAPLKSSGDAPYLMVVYRVPTETAALSEAVQSAYSQYGDLVALRDPLKLSFRLTLTLVLLLTMLAAIYGAIFFAQRLIRPVQDLINGTRAVGKGDFDTRLPLPSRDEMGFLVHSFNDMTKRLRRAHDEATRSQEAVEYERKRLAAILARLSTGVLAVDRELNVRIANAAAGAILGGDLSAATGRPLPEIASGNPRLGQFVAALAVRFAGGKEEWREQIELDGEGGRRTLMCACTPLPGGDDIGYIVVFDDITALLQAQRDAAWGEVARRLAHEIKNPLTPIQLSAERMRKRFLGSMSAEDAEVMERATRTIVQQVTTMQQMVNAFSEYARAPTMQVARFALNALIAEVADLYRSHARRAEINLSLDQRIGVIEADRGRVRQLLNNLLTNALEALEGVTAPRLDIATHLEHSGEVGYAAISVADNGPGFKPELLGRIFDPYVTSKSKGTGLGLAIVKKIVEEHGGRIEADNLPKGGARVRVMLPMKDSTRTAAGRERLAGVM